MCRLLKAGSGGLQADNSVLKGKIVLFQKSDLNVETCNRRYVGFPPLDVASDMFCVYTDKNTFRYQ